MLLIDISNESTICNLIVLNFFVRIIFNFIDWIYSLKFFFHSFLFFYKILSRVFLIISLSLCWRTQSKKFQLFKKLKLCFTRKMSVFKIYQLFEKCCILRNLLNRCFYPKIFFNNIINDIWNFYRIYFVCCYFINLSIELIK